MYMIRPALRASTGRAPARIVHGRRYPSTTRLRTFHSTQYVAQAANPPSTPDNTPIDTNGANKEDRENNAAAGAAEEQPDGVAAEDPEILAQKLQRSREMTRRYSSALRRSQRRNRPQGLPPVHVPDWFLKRRVVRRKDLPPDLQKRVKPRDLSLLLTHPESGERAVCPIPTSRDFEAARMVARLTRALWRRGLSDEEKKKVERIFDGKDQSKETASVLEDVEGGKEAADTGLNRLSESSAVEGTRTDSTKDIEVAVQETEGLRETQTKEPKEGKAAEYYRKREAAKLRIQQTRQRRLSPLVLAEIRATIAASLSAVRPSIGDPFPSAKTNVILHSPSTEQEKLLQRTVQAFAHELGADLVVLEAHDLAQIGGDYLGAGSEPFPHSIRTLGYETYRLNSELPEAYDDIDKEDANGEEIEAQPNHQTGGIEARFDISLNLLRAMSKAFKSPVVHLPAFAQVETEPNGSNQQSPRSQSQSEIQLEDLKISSLLEALIDADEAKESRGLVGVDGLLASTSTASTSQNGKSKNPDFFDYSMGNEVAELDFNSALPVNARPGISLSVAVGPSEASQRLRQKSKIIYIKDIKELNATQYGGRIIQKLEELVRKRRGAGESIMIVGSTGSNDLTPELSPNGVRGLQSEGETDFWRTIVVATEVFKDPAKDEIHANIESERGRYVASPAQQRKFRLINLMHIQDMLRGLDPVASAKIADMERSFEFSRSFSSIIPESSFYRVLTYDEIHRIALTALGLHVMNPGDGHLNWAHVALAMGLLKASDLVKFMDFTKTAENIERGKMERLKPWDAKVKTDRGAEKESNKSSLGARSDLQRVAASATKHEKRLMPGIANPDQIKTTFDQVHVPKETIDSIRTITSLSLLRPDAFNYGILATEKISGALLYGPPGTGKTLLAKAVAKESGSAVLEVSGSQIMDKYVGEGEKNVAAIFSLARKLSPCIVFLDEADAIFASRDAARDRSSHRDILNQFLKEWDGLNDLSVFVMVATNRPFDLDDAVIRRLPRRLLVDLPTQVDRQEIFRIHLRGEQLDESVDLEDLAKRTPFYSGSDIKNVAVSAALACVKEENEQAAMAAVRAAVESQEAPDTTSASSSTPSTTSNASQPAGNAPPVPQLAPGIKYRFPEKRILHARHFDKALQEISASISEDMSSLTAIRKFDEQYGDRKSKKKRDFGFGMKVESNENAARVRT